MRCILVNDANLKTDTYCTYCRKKIGDTYAREIGSRFIYCDYDCYQRTAEMPIVVFGEHAVLVTPSTVRS